MSIRPRALRACAALLLLSVIPAHADEPARAGAITLPGALARARARAPEAIAALGRVREAEARRAGAGVWLEANPELELGAGPRSGDPRTLSLEGRIEQRLEPGRRGARLGVADAEVRRARAASEAQRRELDFAVETAFGEARHAELAVELARRGADLAGRVADAAARRRRAGDVTDLDVDLARVALGRARAAVADAEVARARAIGRLAALIGAAPGEALALAGELAPLPVAPGARAAAARDRADVRELDAAARLAAAERALAAANARPDVGLWLGYEREEGATTLLGGLRLALPLWNRAQGERAAARARHARLSAERDAAAGAAARQVADALEAYARAREAVEVFERDAAPALADGEQLLERGLEAGQLAIGAYLAARQELAEARREQLDRRLALALAAAAARHAAGVAP